MVRTAVLALIAIGIAASTALAACPKQAIPELRKGTPVTILRTDGSTMRASFLRAGESPARLVLENRLVHSQRPPRQFEVPLEEIARLDAPRLMRFHGRRVEIGALVGLGAGVLIGAVIPLATSHGFVPQNRQSGSPIANSEFLEFPPSDRPGAVLLGAFSGALAGTLVGLLVSTLGGQPRSWSCGDVTPGAAAPDSL